MPPAPRRTRRSGQELRELIISAASEQFEQRGYADMSMRALAEETNISVSVLYRHFDGKEHLFATVLMEPFIAFFERFADAWSSQVESPWDDEQLAGQFIRDFYESLLDHRRTLVGWLSVSDTAESQLVDEIRERLRAGLSDLRAIGEYEAGARGFQPEAIRYTNVLVMALTLGLVLMAPWLDGGREDQPADDLLDAATRLTLYGMRLMPGAPPAPGEPGGASPA